MNESIIIYQVLSNIRHNGQDIKTGSFIDSTEITGVETLLAEGIILEIDGATTKEDAKEIVESTVASQKDAEEETAAPTNTWGARKDDEDTEEDKEDVKDETPKGPKTEEVVLEKYTVLKAFEVDDENSKYKGTYEEGDEILLDIDTATALISGGVVEAIEEVKEEDGNNL
jgi:hypothetical protein